MKQTTGMRDSAQGHAAGLSPDETEDAGLSMHHSEDGPEPGSDEEEMMTFHVGGARVSLTVPDRDSLLTIIARRLQQGRGFALATMNVDHLEKLHSDARFREAYAAHDLIVADGNPIVWLARMGGHQVSLVPGSDLVQPLCQIATGKGRSVAIVAGTMDSGEAAARRLINRVPGLRIAVVLAPGFPFDPHGPEADGIIDQLAQSGAGLCLLGIGAPRQEILASRLRARCPGMGIASVGAGIDFVAGRQKRAPKVMQQMRIEWLWRAGLNPIRLGPRYLKGAMILPGHARRALSSRRRSA
ncbi:WecB/TagA/CpsF family glycosyltransferase [Paracoccus nototheniae]|uniref:WecB/TagA/CpsF family glycosyltransferase n=2 Tax=Paracoccus nototheniae TaxID=2489002 RepID=A0ABW4DWA0_9RHOB|nr:WecB/TagA/CpsF family glycosyltransferase [Paracoccus nototheniae]